MNHDVGLVGPAVIVCIWLAFLGLAKLCDRFFGDGR